MKKGAGKPKPEETRVEKPVEPENPKQKVAQLQIPRIDVRSLTVTIRGVSPLLTHAWDKAAQRKMLGKQMHEAQQPDGPRDPDAEYLASIYRLPDGSCGIPALGIKASMIAACTSLGKQVTKVAMRQAFHVMGQMIRVDGTPRMREDVAWLSNHSKPTMRFRAEFTEWSATFRIRYNHGVISPAQIINLLNMGGFAVGLGDYRVECDGDCGMYEVVEGAA